VVKTSNGLIVSYRDRSDQEIRDISHVIWNGNSWSPPQTIFADHWKIAGCPVNGPAMSSENESVYRSWYGIRDSVSHVSFVMSKNAGQDWEQPEMLDNKMPLGRVDIASEDRNVNVSWIGKDDRDETWVKVATMDPISSKFNTTLVTKIDASRRSGVPILISTSNGLYLAYTHVDENFTQVKVKMRGT
jgi:hypothetical protein